jgi:hypothetical protein
MKPKMRAVKRVVYPEQDPRELEPYFSFHMNAMTAERLDGKAEIAEQLAWRDKKIEALKEYIVRINRNHFLR